MIEKLFKNKFIIITISYIKSIIWGILKIILSFPFHSVMMFISAFYSIGIGIAKRNTIKKKQYEEYIFVGTIIVLSSLVYIIYSIYGFLYGMRTNYNLYVSIGIATISFSDITLAIIGVVKTRKSGDIQSKILKLLNLATSFTSMSLTQTALLSVRMKEDNSTANGLFGMLMGGFAFVVGIYIIMYLKKSKIQEE